jgi:hypothetical protein
VFVSAQRTPTGPAVVVRPLLPSAVLGLYSRDDWAVVHRRAMAAVTGASLGPLFNLPTQEQ